jgi:hypothetical protein
MKIRRKKKQKNQVMSDEENRGKEIQRKENAVEEAEMR